MTVKLLTEHHLEFLTLKRGCTGSSESTLVKMPHCRKSHVVAQISLEVGTVIESGVRPTGVQLKRKAKLPTVIVRPFFEQ